LCIRECLDDIAFNLNCFFLRHSCDFFHPRSNTRKPQYTHRKNRPNHHRPQGINPGMIGWASQSAARRYRIVTFKRQKLKVQLKFQPGEYHDWIKNVFFPCRISVLSLHFPRFQFKTPFSGATGTESSPAR
jgi:hypothetical protein